MLGIPCGFAFMMLMVGVGLVQVFDAYPISYVILKTLSVGYLLWLAWKIANAAPTPDSQTTSHPMTFLQSAAFQWVNPKAWTMALTAITVYTPTQTMAAILPVTVLFSAVNLPAVGVWTVLGQQMARILTNTTRRVAFNRVMALLLIASLYPVVFAG